MFKPYKNLGACLSILICLQTSVCPALADAVSEMRKKQEEYKNEMMSPAQREQMKHKKQIETRKEARKLYPDTSFCPPESMRRQGYVLSKDGLWWSLPGSPYKHPNMPLILNNCVLSEDGKYYIGPLGFKFDPKNYKAMKAKYAFINKQNQEKQTPDDQASSKQQNTKNYWQTHRGSVRQATVYQGTTHTDEELKKAVMDAEVNYGPGSVVACEELWRVSYYYYRLRNYRQANRYLKKLLLYRNDPKVQKVIPFKTVISLYEKTNSQMPGATSRKKTK